MGHLEITGLECQQHGAEHNQFVAGQNVDLIAVLVLEAKKKEEAGDGGASGGSTSQ